MRLAILTTETSHHAHFVRALAAAGHDIRVLAQRTFAPPRFPVAHAYEAQRDEYEWGLWFAGKPCTLSAIAPTAGFDDINSPDAVSSLRDAAPDAVVVFGTGRLHRPIIDLCRGRIVNLHGGDPETYRGLDTHLWAVWHRDFPGLVSSLHHLDENIDTGDIVEKRSIPLRHGMKLHELRAANTETCCTIVHDALDQYARTGRFASTPQRTAGRYYSAMPAVLKDICVRRFARYTDTL